MALMLFHGARLEARLDPDGAFLLLEDQDRSKWDHRLINRALEFLNRSAEGSVVSTFHLEAAIAYHHCTAKSYAETDWPAILRLYDHLLAINRSPIYLLNRAIVVPSPGVLLSASWPPCASTSDLAMASPSPEPSSARDWSRPAR